MPPKKGAQNKKQLEKMKQKIVEDKTFGLKNKKGAKAQKYIKSIQQSVQNRGVCIRDSSILLFCYIVFNRILPVFFFIWFGALHISSL
jgi:hypothetical protein